MSLTGQAYQFTLVRVKNSFPITAPATSLILSFFWNKWTCKILHPRFGKHTCSVRERVPPMGTTAAADVGRFIRESLSCAGAGALRAGPPLAVLFSLGPSPHFPAMALRDTRINVRRCHYIYHLGLRNIPSWMRSNMIFRTWMEQRQRVLFHAQLSEILYTTIIFVSNGS